MYNSSITDEAIICERLTKKERVAVIDKMFENYDLKASDIEANIIIKRPRMMAKEGKRGSIVSATSSRGEKLCAVCLEEVVISPFQSSPLPIQPDNIDNNNSLTLSSEDFSNAAKQKSSSTKKYPRLQRRKEDSSSSGSITTDAPPSITDKNQFMIRGYQCDHVYHRACIRPWLEQGKISCPCCRKDMIDPEEFKCAVVSVIRKERLQMMQRWGIREDWIQIND